MEELHLEMGGLVVSDAMMTVMMMMGLSMAKQAAQLLYIIFAIMAKAEN